MEWNPSDLTRQQSEVVVQTVLDGMNDALRFRERVELRGFGSFRLRERKARRGAVPAKRVAHFRVGKELGKLINS